MRVKVDTGTTGTFFGTDQNGTFTATVTSTSTTYTWIDLGEFIPNPVATPPAIVFSGWRSAGGSGSVYIDRVEMFKLEDRSAAVPAYDGARDLGQAILYDARVDPRRVQRR